MRIPTVLFLVAKIEILIKKKYKSVSSFVCFNILPLILSRGEITKN
jgi:hypothetical protein